MQYPNTQILVFAKAPEPGKAKTRLIPELGREGASDLHAHLLSRQMDWLYQARIAPITCWCAPAVSHPLFERFQLQYRISLAPQHPGDLGERMYRAAELELQLAEFVILIGADCPAMTPHYISSAIECLLSGCDAVIGPAEDGGYVLLGLRRSDRALFNDINWGSSEVLATTLDRFKYLGWSYDLLPQLWDLDRPADVERYRRLQLLKGERVVWPQLAPTD